MDCVLVCRNHGWVTELNNKTAQVNCSKEISSYFFSLVDFVIRFITMALKSMVVVQHRRIIPYRRRVTVSVFLFIFVFLIFVFLIIYQILPELPGVTCKWKLVYTLIDGDLYSIINKKCQGCMTLSYVIRLWCKVLPYCTFLNHYKHVFESIYMKTYHLPNIWYIRKCDVHVKTDVHVY